MPGWRSPAGRARLLRELAAHAAELPYGSREEFSGGPPDRWIRAHRQGELGGLRPAARSDVGMSRTQPEMLREGLPAAPGGDPAPGLADLAHAAGAEPRVSPPSINGRQAPNTAVVVSQGKGRHFPPSIAHLDSPARVADHENCSALDTPVPWRRTHGAYGGEGEGATTLKGLVSRHQLLVYFVLAYAISAVALAVLGLPSLAPDGHRNFLSLAMFPVMVVWVGLVGVALTGIVGGRPALRELRDRWRRRSSLIWYAAAILIPPACILLVLNVLRLTVSHAFAPGLDIFGIPAGLVAGFCEEFGWTGFAYPRLRVRLGDLGGAALLGLLWGIWHLPVVDSLGAASPHGPAWPAFFAAFVALVAGLRVLICWIYRHTENVMLAQFMHASSTSFLVILGPMAVLPTQEALWYAIDAAVLWLVAMGVIAAGGYRAPGSAHLKSQQA